MKFAAIPFVLGGGRVVRLKEGTRSRVYEIDDAEALADWLNDREAGYPSLAKFEGGKLWPTTV